MCTWLRASISNRDGFAAELDPFQKDDGMTALDAREVHKIARQSLVDFDDLSDVQIFQRHRRASLRRVGHRTVPLALKLLELLGSSSVEQPSLACGLDDDGQ